VLAENSALVEDCVPEIGRFNGITIPGIRTSVISSFFKMDLMIRLRWIIPIIKSEVKKYIK